MEGNLDLTEKGQYAREVCQTIRVPTAASFSQTEATEEAAGLANSSLLYLLRPPESSDSSSKRSLLLCLPRRMATKAVFDALNRAYGSPCSNNKTASENSAAANSSRCLWGDFERMRSLIAAERNVLSVVFTRHPFDRIILGYRHSKNGTITTATAGAVAAETWPRPVKGAGRSLLYAHPRLLGANKRRTAKRSQFLDYVKTQVRK